MLEFEKLLYSPELKMVLFFLLQKSLKRVQCSNEFKGRHGSSVDDDDDMMIPLLKCQDCNSGV